MRGFSLAGFAACLLEPSAGAQLPPAPIQPIEVRSCDFVPGKGQADLDGLQAELARWISDTAAPEYAAYALFPLMHSAEIDFDLAWVGVWPDGTTMGESLGHYSRNGAPISSAFDSVMRCRDNTNFSALALRRPQNDASFGPMEISTCRLRLGVGLDEAMPAIRQWVEHTASIGSTAAHWLLFPAYGERSDANYNFKWAVGYDSFEGFGRDYDQLTNGGALDVYNELFEFVLHCDSPRLFAVRTMRAAQ